MFLKTYSLIFPLLFWNHICNAEPISGAGIRTPTEGQYPFVVSIGHVNYVQNEQENHFCTGALISDKHVVTSAHCVVDEPSSNIQVHTGSNDLRGGRKYLVSSWKMFSQWALQNRQPIDHRVNDIVVLKLREPVEDAEPAVISNDRNLARRKAIIAGWGQTNTETGRIPRYLQAVDVTALDMMECNDRISTAAGTDIFLSSGFVCTVAYPPAFTECGDSGGPLFIRDGGFYSIIGINSGTCPKGPNTPNTVNVHTRVAPYGAFLRSMLRN